MAVVLGFAINANAEDIKTYETLQVSCNPFASDSIDNQCSSNSNVEPEADLIAQSRRGRGRRRKSKVDGYYAGFGLGGMFPGGSVDFNTESIVNLPEVDYNGGFSGSIFGGIKFNKSLAAELEFLLGFGSSDTEAFDAEIANRADIIREIANEAPDEVTINGNFEDSDINYSAFALYISPKFSLPISNKFDVYISPGIGLSQTNVNYESNSDLSIGIQTDDPNINNTVNGFNNITDDTDRDLSQTGISFQIKAGVSFQISETIGLFGQLRYATLPTESNDEFDTDSLNSFGTQAGLTFNF